MRISLERSVLHEISDDEARALVDAMLGDGSNWRSPIISYRLTAEFQEFWKAEVGHWLHTAQKYGYLDKLTNALRKRANHPTRQTSQGRSVNDGLYRVMLEELGPAMLAHYLLRSGWTFRAWDVPDGTGNDVDLAITSSTGEDVDIQIKVPGTIDPIAAVEHAASQLSASQARTLIAVCSRSELYVALRPGDFATPLVGQTTGHGNGRVDLTGRGKFATPEFEHVSGLLLLDFVPGEPDQLYACTVLLNPWCQTEKALEPRRFPHARVLTLPDDRERFFWQNGEPEDRVFIDGTFVPEEFR